MVNISLYVFTIIGRTAKSVTKLLNFSGRHIWRWFPTIPTIFPTVSYSDVTLDVVTKVNCFRKPWRKVVSKRLLMSKFLRSF